MGWIVGGFVALVTGAGMVLVGIRKLVQEKIGGTDGKEEGRGDRPEDGKAGGAGPASGTAVCSNPTPAESAALSSPKPRAKRAG